MNESIVTVELLKVRCIVGLLPKERVSEQELWIDLSMECEETGVAEHDRLEGFPEHPDYAFACDLLREHVVRRQFRTLETLARECTALLFQQWSAVQKVTFSVRKPGAHPAARNCGIRLTTTRP